MPILQAWLEKNGIELVITRWDGKGASLPTTPSIIRYSSRLDIGEELKKGDKMRGTEFEDEIAESDRRETAKHAHCITGEGLKDLATASKHLIIYDDYIMNHETDKQFGTLVEEVEAFVTLELPYPFLVLNMATKAFNVTPNREELLQKCPEVDPKWEEFGRNYQLDIFSLEQKGQLTFKASSQEEADHLFAFIECVAGDYGFSKAQDKWKVLGWLFSVALPEYPKWANKKTAKA